MTAQQRLLEGGGVIDNSITSYNQNNQNNQILSKSQPVDHQPETVTQVENIEEEQI